MAAAALAAALAVVAAALVLDRGDVKQAATAVQPDAGTASAAPRQTPTAAPPSVPPAEAEPEPARKEETSQAPEEDTAQVTEPAVEPAPQPPAPAPPMDPNAPVPAPDADLAAIEQPVAPPAPIDQPSRHGGVEAAVSGLEAVVGEAEGIGQIGGPALRFRLSVANNTASPLDLSDALLTVESGPDREPCMELMGPGVTVLPSSVQPGQRVEATYVFLVPPEQRSKVLIRFNYSAAAPILAFEGPTPG